MLLAVILGVRAAGFAPAARQVRQPPAGEAGSHLRPIELVPGVLIYVVSYQFVSRSSRLVRREGGGRPRADHQPGPRHPPIRWPGTSRADRNAAGQLSDAGSGGPQPGRIREQLGATDVVLWAPAPDDLQRRRVALPAHPERPAQRCAVHAQRAFTIVEGWSPPAPPARIRPSLVPQPSLGLLAGRAPPAVHGRHPRRWW